jgi:hypothetical protein
MTEAMVNGPDDVFVEREGRIERVPDRLFEWEEPVLHLRGWVGRSPGHGRFVDRERCRFTGSERRAAK